ncbi:hypothetical protein LINPERPRIM_LOCUS34568, partial [Linum perenne]
SSPPPPSVSRPRSLISGGSISSLGFESLISEIADASLDIMRDYRISLDKELLLVPPLRHRPSRFSGHRPIIRHRFGLPQRRQLLLDLLLLSDSISFRILTFGAEPVVNRGGDDEQRRSVDGEDEHYRDEEVEEQQQE